MSEIEVGNVRFRSIQGADGKYVGTYLLTSEEVEGVDPVYVEYVGGTHVSQIVGPSPS